MQPNQKLIFFDVDGTIITEDHRIPVSTVQAIHSAQARGHRCVVNTGRPHAHIEPAVTAIGFDGYICSCGQYILYQDQCLFHAQVDPDLSRDIVALVRRCDMDPIYEAEDGIYYDLTRPIQNRLVQESFDRYRELGFDVTASIDAPGFHFDKFCVYPRPHSDLEQFTAFVSQHFQIIHREYNMLEMVKLGCSKETGIRLLMDHLGCREEDCYAIGDSTNDIPMLQSVPHSIAMGHAPAEVKALASYVTDDIDQDGLAKGLAHFGLC